MISKFYLARLKNASVPELVYRLRQVLLVACLKRLIRSSRDPVKVPVAARPDVRSINWPTFRLEIGREDIEEILRGKVYTLNSDPALLTRAEETTGRLFFSDIRASRLSCDIRGLWEPARLQHLTALIVYARQTRNLPEIEAIRQFVRKEVLRWLDSNPFLYGPHYISAMECALRAPVFFYCLKFLDNSNEREAERILDALYRHGWWIFRRLSLHSSLGNHTVAESVGLIFAGALFRGSGEGNRWLARGIDLLTQELEHQVLADGGPAEQSLSYHRFVLDLYWLAIDFLESNSLHDCASLKGRLMLGEEFLMAFSSSDGSMPAVGDSDDGYADAPGVSPKRITPSAVVMRCRTFPISGYSTIRTGRSVILCFDHGPLGMPPLFNHGHADALAITLTKNGAQILIDPGTYRYNGLPQWRRYFKGTSAHNTVCIDGEDQAVQETGFIWSHPYRTELVKSLEVPGGVILEAVHNGYGRLRNPVEHRRKILWFRDTIFLVKDIFSGTGDHEFVLNYHLHPEAAMVNENGWWRIVNNGSEVLMRLGCGDDFSVCRGMENPPSGWYSPAYGTLAETTTLFCRKKGASREISFITVICTEQAIDDRTLGELLCIL